jgi:hypothetical protein
MGIASTVLLGAAGSALWEGLRGVLNHLNASPGREALPPSPIQADPLSSDTFEDRWRGLKEAPNFPKAARKTGLRWPGRNRVLCILKKPLLVFDGLPYTMAQIATEARTSVISVEKMREGRPVTLVTAHKVLNAIAKLTARPLSAGELLTTRPWLEFGND